MLCNSCMMTEEEKVNDIDIFAITMEVYRLTIDSHNISSLSSDVCFENEEYSINLSNNSNYYDENRSTTKILSIYNKNCVLFDSGANVCMVNSKELFEVFNPCTKKIRVKGVSNSLMQCDGSGTLFGPLAGVPALYVPELRASIVSEHVIECFCDINRTKKVGNENAFYSIINNANGQSMQFVKSKEWLYCGDLSKEVEANASKSEFVVQMANVEEMQRAGLTTNEIEKMGRVDRAHRATGFQSMYKMLRSKLHNTIAGTPETGEFSEKDVRNYAKSMHPAWCRGCNASALAEPAHSLDPISPTGINEAHGDGWFLTAMVGDGKKSVKQSYMLFVDNKTQNVLCFLLKADGNTKDFIEVFE